MNSKRLLVAGTAFLLCSWVGASMARADGWTDTIKIYGDMRYRLESIQDESQSGAGKSWYRDRDRIRARVGVDAALDDYWTADVRIATDENGVTGGNGFEDSNNQTLGDLDSKKPVWIDLAYVDYKIFFNNGKLTAGKMNNPFDKVGGSTLIWSNNLTPEGWAGKFNLDLMQDTSVSLNTAGYWIRENAATADQQMYGAQALLKTKVDDLKIAAGFGYYDYVNTYGQTAFDYKGTTYTASGYGNTLNTPKITTAGTYANNFMLGEASLSLTYPIMDLPVMVYGDWVLNNGAQHFNRAWLAGLVLNKAKSEGSWELGYNYRMLEKDSVLGAFSDEDFAGGGTDAKGHQVYASYMIADGVKTNLTFFRDQLKIDTAVNPYYNRFQADVVLSF